MKLIFVVGGAGQDKLAMTRRKFPDACVAPLFSDQVRKALKKNQDPMGMTRDYLASMREKLSNEEVLAVVSDEVGCGIVPMDQSERIFREANGRVNCLLAGEADEVYRIVVGVFQRIK